VFSRGLNFHRIVRDEKAAEERVPEIHEGIVLSVMTFCVRNPPSKLKVLMKSSSWN
jgi:hypothetical protein